MLSEDVVIVRGGRKAPTGTWGGLGPMWGSAEQEKEKRRINPTGSAKLGVIAREVCETVGWEG